MVNSRKNCHHWMMDGGGKEEKMIIKFYLHDKVAVTSFRSFLSRIVAMAMMIFRESPCH